MLKSLSLHGNRYDQVLAKFSFAHNSQEMVASKFLIGTRILQALWYDFDFPDCMGYQDRKGNGS